MEPATNLDVAFWAFLILANVVREKDKIMGNVYLVVALIVLILGKIL